MELKKFNKDGYLISKNLFKIEDINKLERSLIQYTSLYLKKFSKKLYLQGSNILKEKNNKFRDKSLEFFSSIEKYNKKIFYDVCKNIFRVEIANVFFKTKKIDRILEKYFGKSYLIVQKAHPMLLFNSKVTKRLMFEWHQECHFYEQKKGIHLWFPIFRNVKASNDGSLKIALKSNKKIYSYKKKKNKNGYIQKIPLVNVDKKFKTKSIKLNRSDAVIFDHRTFHKTDVQNNKKPRTAVVVKFLADNSKEQLLFINQ